ncbi:MAG: hypothetical protein KME64_29985 [Scytonematopsis contorta HA4267-MV1]|nr:hypothetical protein [Scytonematopsis contorta HA4267-MV1]
MIILKITHKAKIAAELESGPAIPNLNLPKYDTKTPVITELISALVTPWEKYDAKIPEKISAANEIL